MTSLKTHNSPATDPKDVEVLKYQVKNFKMPFKKINFLRKHIKQLNKLRTM
jgi:hypothetical protein